MLFFCSLKPDWIYPEKSHITVLLYLSSREQGGSLVGMNFNQQIDGLDKDTVVTTS